MSAPSILLDVTRLVWRVWRGRLPTGVDRVCLAYLDHYGPHSLAVVQRRGLKLLFSAAASQRLFRILRDGGAAARRRLVAFFALHGASALLRRPAKGNLYLNVGHTGLDDRPLPEWIAEHRLNAVYLIHDLIPITHPTFCRPGERERHERRMRHVLESASGVIGNSAATINDLSEFAASEGRPLPPTLAAWIAGNPVRTAGNVAPSPARPYFLIVSTIEARKNHVLLLDVWERLVARLGDAAPRLLIVGGRGWEAEDVFRRLDALGPLAGHVAELRSCSDDELAALLGGARALLMPSFAEGYGLPVFEALEAGTPVIAADLPVYREVAGDLPLLLPADDVSAWEQVIEAYTGDAPDRRERIERLRRFRVPRWPEHFAAVDKWLASLPGDPPVGAGPTSR